MRLELRDGAFWLDGHWWGAASRSTHLPTGRQLKIVITGWALWRRGKPPLRGRVYSTARNENLAKCPLLAGICLKDGELVWANDGEVVDPHLLVDFREVRYTIEVDEEGQ